MEPKDWLMILSVLSAPLFAVQVQKWLEKYRETKNRKISIFKTLMSTRAMGLSREHVQALNLIDLEFNGRKYQNVRDSWREYLDHLGSFPKDDQNALAVWGDKKADLLASLLIQMGKSLNYKFDSVHIKKGIYLPEGHTKIENELSHLRIGLIHLLNGSSSIKVTIDNQNKDSDEP